MKTRSLPSLIVHYLKIGYVFGQDISDLLTKVRPYALRGGVAWPLGAVESNMAFFSFGQTKKDMCFSITKNKNKTTKSSKIYSDACTFVTWNKYIVTQGALPLSPYANN